MMITVKPKVSFTVDIVLTEGQLGALDAMVGYGFEPFLNVFKEKLGESYIGRFEKDLKDLFDGIEAIRPAVNVIKETRKRLNLPQL